MDERERREVVRSDSLSDVVFEIALRLGKKGSGKFLEVGAYDGVIQSNTLRLERELNWSGVLIEPSSQYEFLKKNRSRDNSYYRVALVDDESKKTVKGLFDGSLNGTADPSLMAFFRGSRRPKNSKQLLRYLRTSLRRIVRGRSAPDKKALVTVPAKTLSTVVGDSSLDRIDLFSLDVEGMELDVLRGYGFEVRPRVIVVETRAGDSLAISDLLLRRNYLLVGGWGLGLEDKFDPRLTFLNLIWADANDNEAILASKVALAS